MDNITERFLEGLNKAQEEYDRYYTEDPNHEMWYEHWLEWVDDYLTIKYGLDRNDWIDSVDDEDLKTSPKKFVEWYEYKFDNLTPLT